MKNKKIKIDHLHKFHYYTAVFLIILAGIGFALHKYYMYFQEPVYIVPAVYVPRRVKEVAPATEKPKEVSLNFYDQLKAEAKKACTKHKLGDYCIDDLLAIAKTEKRDFNCQGKPGDNGCSWGCFQINRCVHERVTIGQAQDVVFSTNWTLNRLVHYGYPVMRSYAIRKHNGNPTIPQTARYLEKVNEFAKL